MGVLKQFVGLPKQVYMLSLVRTIMTMGSFVFAFISLMASNYLGFNQLQAGNVMMFVAIANVGGSLIGGKLSDTYGRKRLFLVADFFAVVTIALAGVFCKTLTGLVVMIISYAFSSMATPAIAAMITDYSEEENRSECFSLLYLSQNIGFAVGPAVGGLLFYHYMEWAFYGQAILYAMSGIGMIVFAKDCYEPIKGAAKKREQSLFTALRQIPIMVAFILCLIILTMCYQEISFMLPLQFTELYGLEQGSRYAGLIWSVNAIVCVTFTPFIVTFSKKRNQLLNIAFAGLLYGVGFGLNGVVKSIGWFFFAVAVWTTGEILVSTSSGVFIANHAPETHRARFQSLYEVARGFGRGIGPNVFGYYLLTHTYSQAWGVTSAICMVAIVFILLLYRADNKQEALQRTQI